MRRFLCGLVQAAWVMSGSESGVGVGVGVGVWVGRLVRVKVRAARRPVWLQHSPGCLRPVLDDAERRALLTLLSKWNEGRR